MNTVDTKTRIPTDETTLAKNETHDLISADKVEGTRVYDRAGEAVGEVDDIMIDKRTGKVAYAVASFGGLFGIGSTHYALPWSMLDYDVDRNGYVVDIDADKLKGAPQYDAKVSLADRKWGAQVHDYYGVPPYWV